MMKETDDNLHCDGLTEDIDVIGGEMIGAQRDESINEEATKNIQQLPSRTIQ